MLGLVIFLILSYLVISCSILSNHVISCPQVYRAQRQGSRLTNITEGGEVQAWSQRFSLHFAAVAGDTVKARQLLDAGTRYCVIQK
jgi:hypothetical protein